MKTIKFTLPLMVGIMLIGFSTIKPMEIDKTKVTEEGRERLIGLIDRLKESLGAPEGMYELIISGKKPRGASDLYENDLKINLELIRDFIKPLGSSLPEKNISTYLDKLYEAFSDEPVKYEFDTVSFSENNVNLEVKRPKPILDYIYAKYLK